MCLVLCRAFFLQLITDNTCILSCAISPIGANSPLNESSEELRMKRLRFSFFSPLKIMQAEIDLESLPFIFLGLK